MSDLVGNPEERFPRIMAHLMYIFMQQGVSRRLVEDDMFGELELTNQKTASETKKEMTCFGKMPHPNDKPHGLSDKVFNNNSLFII